MWNDEEHLKPGEQANQPDSSVESPASADHTAHSRPESFADDAFLRTLFDGPQTEKAPVSESEAPLKKCRWSMEFTGAFLRDRRTWLFLTAVLLIIGIVCLVVFGGMRALDQAVRLVRYSGDDTVFSFDAHNANSYISFHDGLAIASVSGLMCFDKNGTETAAIQNQMELPVLLANDTVAMCYGIGDSSICSLHYKKGAREQISVPGTLLDAHLSDDSCIAYSSVQPGYKTVLTALNSAGVEVYSWYSSTRFFSQCAVSKGSELLAAIALGQSGSSFDAACVLFATDQEEPVAELSLGNDLIYDLDFVSEDKLCAVGETALHFFRADGSGHAEYSYDGGELLYYELNADSFAAIVRDMNQAGSRYQITTVGHDGVELASLSVDAEILDISANGRYLAVLTTDRLCVYDSRLRLSLSEDNVGFATQVCVQKDGAALLIDGSSAYRVS